MELFVSNVINIYEKKVICNHSQAHLCTARFNIEVSMLSHCIYILYIYASSYMFINSCLRTLDFEIYGIR